MTHTQSRNNEKFCNGCNKIAKFHRHKNRKDGLQSLCVDCTGNGKTRHYTKFKKNHCENCPFIAEDPCQLDIDHIDGNHQNNDPSNLKTLCACCHRLKTRRNKDNRTMAHRAKLNW